MNHNHSKQILGLIKKVGVSSSLAFYGLNLMADTVKPVFAVANKPATTNKVDNGIQELPGIWSGKDGDCNWEYDIVTRTLTIKGTQKNSTLSSRPFNEEWTWGDNITHIVFASPVKLPADSKNKFSKLNNLKDIKGLDLVDTSEVTDMKGLFARDEALTELDLSHFQTDKVTDMSGMFESTGLSTLDLSSFNTSSVIKMNSMFSGCTAKSINLTSFNTSRVTEMSNMFSLTKLQNLNFDNLDTNNVTDMSGMFEQADISNLDFAKLNTSKVTNMGSMFSGTTGLKILDLSSLDTSNVINMSNMFGSSKITKLVLDNWDTQ